MKATQEQFKRRYNALSPKTRKKIELGKRLTKEEIALSFLSVGFYNRFKNTVKREKFVEQFNVYFGTKIK